MSGFFKALEISRNVLETAKKPYDLVSGAIGIGLPVAGFFLGAITGGGGGGIVAALKEEVIQPRLELRRRKEHIRRFLASEGIMS